GWVWAIILPFGDQRRFEATGAFQLLNGFEYFSGDGGAGFAAGGPALNHDEHHVAGVFIGSVRGEPCDVIDDAILQVGFLSGAGFAADTKAGNEGGFASAIGVLDIGEHGLANNVQAVALDSQVATDFGTG